MVEGADEPPPPHELLPGRLQRAVAHRQAVLDRVVLLRPRHRGALDLVARERVAELEDELARARVLELLELAELGVVVREVVELAQVGAPLGPHVRRRLAVDEVPAVTVLQLERVDLGLGHRPLEEHREEAEQHPLHPLVEQARDRRLAGRLLVAVEDDEEAELRQHDVVQHHHEVRVAELVGRL